MKREEDFDFDSDSDDVDIEFSSDEEEEEKSTGQIVFPLTSLTRKTLEMTEHLIKLRILSFLPVPLKQNK